MTDFPMISTVQDAVLMLMATQAPALWLIGINLFKSFAVIKLVWWGGLTPLSMAQISGHSSR